MLSSRAALNASRVPGTGVRARARGSRGARAWRLVFACVFFALPFTAARAQTGGPGGTHSIYGDFKVDESKAGGMVPISFVLVLMTDTGRVVERQSVMPDTRYRFQGLLEGVYDLSVESAGMPVARFRIPVFATRRMEFKQDITLEWEREGGTRPESRKAGTISAADAYERTPANRALFEKASGAVRKKKFEEAASLLRQIVESDPKDHIAWTDLGRLKHYQLGDTAEAERSYTRALDARPDFLLAAVNLGTLHLAAKSFQQAIEVLKPAVEKHPLSADAHELLGEAYLQTGKFDVALTHFAEAIRLDSDGKADAHRRLAMLYDAAGRKDLAAAELEQYNAKRPNNPDRKKFEQYIKANKK